MSFNIKKMHKKGSVGMDSTMAKIFAGILLVLLIVNVVSIVFDNLDGMSGAESTVPEYLPVLLGLIFAFGVIFAVYNVFKFKSN